MKKFIMLVLIVLLGTAVGSVPGYAQMNNPEINYITLLNDRAGHGPFYFRLQGWNLTGGYSYALFPLAENGNPKDYPVEGRFAERVNIGSEQLYVVFEAERTLTPGMYTLVIKAQDKVISPVNQLTLYLGTVTQVIPLNTTIGMGPHVFICEGEELTGGYKYEINRVQDESTVQLCDGEYSETAGSGRKSLMVTFEPLNQLSEGKYTLTIRAELGSTKKVITEVTFFLSRAGVGEVIFDPVADNAYIRYTIKGKNLTGGYIYELRSLDADSGSLPGQFLEERISPDFIVLAFIPDQSSFRDGQYRLLIYQSSGMGQREEISPENWAIIQRSNVEGRGYGE